MLARHLRKARGAFQPDGGMAEFGERVQVAPRPAAEIEDGEWRRGSDVLQQRRDVLADIVAARAFAEVGGALLVVLERPGGDFFQVLRVQLHIQ